MKKIAIATEEENVSSHFGRCPIYTLIEIQEEKIVKKEEFPNPGHQPGLIPRLLSKKGINTIIAGGMGPRAQAIFAEKNIETIIGVQGKVSDVVQKYINNKLETSRDLCDHSSKIKDNCDRDYHFKGKSHALGSKICITSEGKSMDSEVNPKFGHSPYFIIIDPSTLKTEVIKNPHQELSQGAAIQTIQLIAKKKVGLVITGHCGPNAQRILHSSGIRIITGASGKVKDALLKYKPEIKTCQKMRFR